MTENTPSFKSFDEPGPPAAGLPPLFAELLAGRQIFRSLSAEDLREMSKFWEIPNVAGLAAHALERPAPAGFDPETSQRPGPPELPADVLEVLKLVLIRNPSVMVEGTLASASARPVRVALIVPMGNSQIAQTFHHMLWPSQNSVPPAQPDYVLFVWPEALRRKKGLLVAESLVGHWPAAGTGVLIGYDDPWAVSRMLAAAARRIWAAELPGSRATPPAAQASLLHSPPARDALASWDEVLVEDVPDKGSRITPLWANPMLPARVLAQRPKWRAAALAIGALPLGVAVDAEGRFPLFHGISAPPAGEDVAAGGWVIIPRTALK